MNNRAALEAEIEGLEAEGDDDTPMGEAVYAMLCEDRAVEWLSNNPIYK